MSEKTTTSNGYEIKNPIAELSAAEFREHMGREYGIDGETPDDRIRQLKSVSVEGIAILIEDINKSVQGSADSLMLHDRVSKIGEQEALSPDDRYDVFIKLVDDIKNAPDNINPARVADTLAMGVVLLHPFQDGNGRTARTIGLLFRDNYDELDYESDYNQITEPRDIARQRGGMVIFGYTPRFADGFDQTDPQSVSKYLSSLLTDSSDEQYISCYGPTMLYESASNKAA